MSRHIYKSDYTSDYDSGLIPAAQRIARHDSEGPRKTVWLVTFTDMMALMLTFFVLSYSMSTPVGGEFEKISESFTKEFSRFLGAKNRPAEIESISLDRLNFENALDLDYLEAVLNNQMAQNGLSNSVTINRFQNSLSLSFPDELLFAKGQSKVRAESLNLLQKLSAILNRIDNSIEITGHSDPSPISANNTAFSSNWDLSLKRAQSVAKILVDSGYKKKLAITSQGSSNFSLLPEKMSTERKSSLSRRVDILIFETNGSRLERLGIESSE